MISSKSPNVIYKNKYCLSLSSKRNKTIKEKQFKDIDNMIDYFKNDKKMAIGMFEYYMGHTRGEHNNLVLEDGRYATNEEIKNIKRNYQKYIVNSNLWKGILSFRREYLDENIDIRTLELKLAKEILPQFFKYCGFKNVKNMSYCFSVHQNRIHQPHIHFAFIEKNPNYILNNKLTYRTKGKITISEQRYLKRIVCLAIEKEKYYTPLLKKTNEDIDSLKKYFNKNDKNCILNNINDIYLEEDIVSLGQMLNRYRNIKNMKSTRAKYNSICNDELGREIKKKVKNIKKEIFSNKDSILFKLENSINKDLKELNFYFNELNKNNNVKEHINSNKLVESKKKYINNYIYNAIINHSIGLYKDLFNKNKDNITLEEVICEVTNTFFIGEKDYKNIRKEILKNNFCNVDYKDKFKNTYNFEKALKNIRYEMEVAAKEFSKLFEFNR